jgi:hypothetical protein
MREVRHEHTSSEKSGARSRLPLYVSTRKGDLREREERNAQRKDEVEGIDPVIGHRVPVRDQEVAYLK